MPRSLCAVVLVLICSSAAGDEKAAQARLLAFRQEAAARRAERGLSVEDPALLAQYPAPVLLGGGAGTELPRACPGQTVQVSLPGRIVPGSLAVVLSDDVEVVSESLGPKGWDAKLKVRPQAWPGDVLVKVMSPVSEAHAVARLLDVGCQHRWELELSSGERLTVITRWPTGANTGVKAEGTWSKGGKPLGTSALVVHGGATFSFERAITPEERAIAARVQSSVELQAADAKLALLQQKVNGCSKGPAAQQQQCLQAGGEELTRSSLARDAIYARLISGLAPKVGCELIRVRRGPGGLAGDAQRCSSGAERATVSGVVTAIP